MNDALRMEKLGYIHISPRSARVLSGEVALYAEEMKALVYLEDVLKSGDFSGWKPSTKTDKKPNVVGYGVLSKLARIDGRVRRIDATIEKYKDGKLFYYLRMKKLPSKVASSSFKQGDQHSRFAHLAPPLENPIEGLNSDSTLSVSYVQGTIGEWFPDVRAIATWTGANHSTFLYETGHMFLDMRTRIAVKLKAKKDSEVELTKGEQHLLNSLEATMKRFGTDLDSFSKMSVDQQRPMHEKFAQTFVSFLLGSCPAPVLDPSVPEMLCHRYQEAFGAEENPRVLAKAELVISEMLTYYHETPTWVFPVLWKSMQVQNRETVCQAT